MPALGLMIAGVLHKPSDDTSCDLNLSRVVDGINRWLEKIRTGLTPAQL